MVNSSNLRCGWVTNMYIFRNDQRVKFRSYIALPQQAMFQSLATRLFIGGIWLRKWKRNETGGAFISTVGHRLRTGLQAHPASCYTHLIHSTTDHICIRIPTNEMLQTVYVHLTQLISHQWTTQGFHIWIYSNAYRKMQQLTIHLCSELLVGA